MKKGIQNKYSIICKGIALFLACAMVNIYITDAYCTFSKEDKHSPSAEVDHKHNHEHKRNASHSHETSHKHDHDVTNTEDESHEHHHSTIKHDHNKSESQRKEECHHSKCDHEKKGEESCCKDDSLAFFSSLNYQSSTIFSFNISSVTLVSWVEPLTDIFCSPIVSSKGFFKPAKPPPKIPDIRIFIQSFII